MRQTHCGGEKAFVDYAGDTIDIFDPITGEMPMKLFVAAMAAAAIHSSVSCAIGGGPPSSISTNPRRSSKRSASLNRRRAADRPAAYSARSRIRSVVAVPMNTALSSDGDHAARRGAENVA
jgi:hypothetical protein